MSRCKKKSKLNGIEFLTPFNERTTRQRIFQVPRHQKVTVHLLANNPKQKSANIVTVELEIK